MKTAVNTIAGKITHGEVAKEFSSLPNATVDEALKEAPKPDKGRIKVVIPAPIKPYEHRIGVLPSGVKELLRWAADESIDVEFAVDLRLGESLKHTSGMEDITIEAYRQAGAEIYEDRRELMRGGHIYHFTKEPQGDELEHIEEGATVHTYFHYTGFPQQLVKWALDKRITSMAFETRTDEDGNLICLQPMSHVDGRSNALITAAILNPQIIQLRKAA